MRFTVNGLAREYTGPAFKRLIDVLREDLRLTGTKEGCGEGECGACTVLLGGRPVNSCLVPVAQVEGTHVVTIEGLGSLERPGRLQRCFLDKGGAQCGICTPGMIVSAHAWTVSEGPKTADACRRALAGNICRCTGYQHIVESVLAAVPRTARKPKPARRTVRGKSRAR